MMKELINPVFHKAYDIIYAYIEQNPEIKKAVVFGNALITDELMDLNEEMHVAIYLNDPTPEKIENISRYINNNIADVWGCLIDDEKYQNTPILHQAISKGIIIYGE